MTITLRPTIRFGSSTPSLMGWILQAAGFARVEVEGDGEGWLCAGDLLKLYIYGYLNRVRSSRRLGHKLIKRIPFLGDGDSSSLMGSEHDAAPVRAI